MRAREAITSVPDGDFGSVRMQNVVPRFVNDPGSVRHSGGALGQDNDEIYGEWLSLSPQERARLKDAAVI
jgi:crotonobetainyl-CoA:carnitine CoA-transferase CaiB-like acyl-CoA transferase